ncbi:hypothetical protein Droror1_Dr00015478 [Drosera rotundifolia]
MGRGDPTPSGVGWVRVTLSGVVGPTSWMLGISGNSCGIVGPSSPSSGREGNSGGPCPGNTFGPIRMGLGLGPLGLKNMGGEGRGLGMVDENAIGFFRRVEEIAEIVDMFFPCIFRRH